MEDIENELLECREKESVLRKQYDELQDFVENASIPLHWVNGSGIVIWANKVELELLGYSQEEYVGKHISHFHADQRVIEDILKRLIDKETLINYPARLKCKNGEIREVLINSNVLWKDNKFIHTRCFTRDITELRKQEEKKVEQIVELENRIQELKQENEKLRSATR